MSGTKELTKLTTDVVLVEAGEHWLTDEVLLLHVCDECLLFL